MVARVSLLLALGIAPALPAQGPAPAAGERAKTGGSSNVRMVGHLPMEGYFTVGGPDVEQELSRPYIYISGFYDKAGFSIVSIADPAKPKLIHQVRWPRTPEHGGLGGENGRYFKLQNRYYYAKTIQFNTPGPDDTLGLVIYDVTGLPNPATVRRVGHVGPIGARVVHVFPYKHSDGRTLLITTPNVGPYAQIFDAAKLVSGAIGEEALVGRVGVPTDLLNLKQVTRGYHDSYAQYDPNTRQDKFYGAGAGGFHVYDITKPEDARHLFSMSGGNGVLAGGHTVVPSPDSRFAVGTTERQYWPVFLWDMKDGIDGKTKSLSAPAGAWTADWQNAAHIVEMRWPYVFVAAFEDGLQIFNMINPRAPRTEGWYYTCMCDHQMGWGGNPFTPGTTVLNGAADVDIRNADGLIVLTDYTSGLWLFRLEGFDGWNGRNWRMPNLGTEQDWEKGPVPLTQ